MFVVLTVVDGLCYFDLTGVDKYSQVAVLSIENLEKPVPVEEPVVEEPVEPDVTIDEE